MAYMIDDIQKTALACANEEIYFDALWHDLLERMLLYWHADIKMNLWEATNVMLNSAGYQYGRGWFVTKEYDFWYKYENDDCLNVPPISPHIVIGVAVGLNFRKERAFKMTIAVFETINYWCNFTDPLRITLTREDLLQTLINGRIHIDWNSYKFNL